MNLSITKCQKEDIIFKNKSTHGKNNICGVKIAELRRDMQPKTSQRKLASLLQPEELELDKNAAQKIESGQRFVIDIEIKIIARVPGVSYSELLY